MKDIVLRSFQELGIAGKNLLNCIRNPIAYATTCYDFQNYNKYFLISYWYDTWRVLDKNFIEEQNSFLDYLNIELKQEITQDQDLFIHMIQNHIDQDQPVFIFLDYYNIFYNKTFYKKEHIPHGIIITGYDETNHTFGLRERIIINPDGLYDFQLTEDMMYDMWEASCETLRKEHKIYYFQKYNNAMSLEIEEILQNLYLEAEQNTLIRYIQKFDTEFTAVDGFILRRQYDATVYFFELLEKIILSNALVSETEEFAKKYLEFINLFINKTIKNMMIGEISKNKMEKEIKQLLELDHQLFTLIDKILSNYQSIKNVAYQCKVTASSMVESDIAYSPDKTVNGKYSDEVMLQIGRAHV